MKAIKKCRVGARNTYEPSKQPFGKKAGEMGQVK